MAAANPQGSPVLSSFVGYSTWQEHFQQLSLEWEGPVTIHHLSTFTRSRGMPVEKRCLMQYQREDMSISAHFAFSYLLEFVQKVKSRRKDEKNVAYTIGLFALTWQTAVNEMGKAEGSREIFCKGCGSYRDFCDQV